MRSLTLERLLGAMYGSDRVTKGDGTNVEADGDRRHNRSSSAMSNDPVTMRAAHTENRGDAASRQPISILRDASMPENTMPVP